MGPLSEEGIRGAEDSDEEDPLGGMGDFMNQQAGGQPEEWMDWHKLKADMAKDKESEVAHDEL